MGGYKKEKFKKEKRRLQFYSEIAKLLKKFMFVLVEWRPTALFE